MYAFEGYSGQMADVSTTDYTCKRKGEGQIKNMDEDVIHKGKEHLGVAWCGGKMILALYINSEVSQVKMSSRRLGYLDIWVWSSGECQHRGGT